MSVESLIMLVVQLVVLGVVFGLLVWIVDHVPMLGPFQQVARTIIIVIGALIAIVLLLQFAGLISSGGRLFKFG